MKKRIGIFGGSFDPVHKDHVAMCLAFEKTLGLDRTFVVPARLSPFKNGTFASADDRYAMLKLAFADSSIEVSRFELDSVDTNYTYKTVEYFHETFPDADLFYLLGSDSLKTFPNWKNPHIIASLAKICVVCRTGENLDEGCAVFAEKFGYKPVIVDFYGVCSSTEVRERLALGLPCDDFLPPDVKDYIEDERLYTADKIHAFLRSVLSEKRRVHTVGVFLTAKALAEKNGADVNKACLAALLHDVAKYLNPDDYEGFSCDPNCPSSVVHQFLGAYVAEKVLGISDEEVLGAVRWHTTGRPNMTLLEKIVFVADLLEPGRTFDGVLDLRRAVERDFEIGFRRCVHELLLFLQKGNGYLYKTTLETDEYYNKEYYE